MKLESLESKSSSFVAVEATKLIQKMYRHILNDGCIHCKHILNGDNNE